MNIVVDECIFLNQIKDKIRYIMVSRPFDKKKIADYIQNGFTPILNLYQLIAPFEMNDVLEEISPYKDMDCLFYITDLGLVYQLKQEGLINKIIFDPITLITNSLDAKEYFNEGFRALGISNEIILKDAINIAKDIHGFYQIFGYRLMFHSKRRLVELYGNRLNQQLKDGTYILKEENREDRYPLIQNSYGTMIYRSYLINLLSFLPNLNMEFCYLNSNFISSDVYAKVIQIYLDVLNGKDLSLAIAEMNGLNLNCSDGFTYQDSIYQKEDF